MALTPDRVRVLFLSDTHVGVDLPAHPRVERRRRGEDFFACFAAALAPALAGDADVVVHGGDVFDHPRVPAALVERALSLLLAVARAGVPVLVVPGNHERSRVDVPLLLRHPLLHVFASPGCHVVERRGLRVAFAGFPYVRDGVRRRFRALLAETGLAAARADARVLCMHHCVEGATCGPGEHVFRDAPDVVRGAELPEDAAVVLTGHVHRHQRLARDLAGRPLPAPVLYAGSVERTSFAEKDETKGYGLVEVEGGHAGRGRLAAARFVPLPARPMVLAPLSVAGRSRADLEAAVAAAIAAAPADAVLRLRLDALPTGDAAPALRAETLRAMAPASMNVDVGYAARHGDAPRSARARRAG